MKKIITLLTALCLLLSLFAIGASAEESPLIVYVTVSLKGELVATQVAVTLNDYDNDGATTVNDALYGVHKQLYQGGADAGYGYYTGDYGLSMSKLWGDESGSFGYYLNHASCRSLADPVKDGDFVTAFVYESADWSDVYTYFDVSAQTVELGEEVTLTLMAAGYDENWNPITYPVQGATITMDGYPVYMTSSGSSERTPAWVTDQNGQVTISINAISGNASLSRVISATSNEMTIVPPVCMLSLILPESDAKSAESASTNSCQAVIGTGLIALLPLAYLCIRRKEK